ncbi:MAG: hypothetical protein WC760_10945 [Bacteroidia bacterium]|jgi:hypothetical protein
MIPKILTNSLFVLITFAFLSFDLPRGWFKAGSASDCYEMGIDPGAGPNGKNVASIKSIKKTKGFGTLMQSCLADTFRGKKIRMSGYVKALNVKGWAGLWLRIDKENDYTETLGFDNMSNRPIRKTSDWTRYEIVLKVPEKAHSLAYGALLAGKGQIWFNDLQFEIVHDSVPTTGNDCKVCSKVLTEPGNLNFEK